MDDPYASLQFPTNFHKMFIISFIIRSVTQPHRLIFTFQHIHVEYYLSHENYHFFFIIKIYIIVVIILENNKIDIICIIGI